MAKTIENSPLDLKEIGLEQNTLSSLEGLVSSKEIKWNSNIDLKQFGLE